MHVHAILHKEITKRFDVQAGVQIPYLTDPLSDRHKQKHASNGYFIFLSFPMWASKSIERMISPVLLTN